MKPIASFNGEIIDADQLQIPVYDTGFMLGVTVSEQLRTFRGRPFHVTQHLERLRGGLQLIGLDDRVDINALGPVIEEIAEHNYGLGQPEDDLGVTVFVTPGPYRTYVPEGTPQPNVAVHTYPLPFQLWHRQYQHGQPLQVVDVQQIRPQSWPPELKCRSRMHYYLADRRAKEVDPAATAVLLDSDGFVSETPIANLVIYHKSRGLLSPPREKILPGVSLEFLHQLATDLELPIQFHDLTVKDLESADEILLTRTPYCVMPAASINGISLPAGGADTIFARFLRAWSEDVQVDIAKQAETIARERVR